MSFRSWRERKLLSQERVAEMSGLSLRTVQRLDAGHRVSYASLRALAATFEIDVDLLERELYAMNKPTDDFVEVPRWVRILDDTRWFGGPGLSRRDAHLLEAIIAGCVVILFVASFLVSSEGVAKILRAGAVIELVAAYMVSRYIRVSDKYRLWSGANGGATEPKQIRRIWKSIAAEYSYFFGVGLLSVVIVCWVTF
jgi:transcriptional regulator with XRE-family HTH domain